MPRFTPSWLARAAVAGLAVVVAGLSWPSAGASAAMADGRLSGRVQDHYGVTVAGADVSLADSVTQTPVGRTTTDVNGAYSLAIPEGTYDATVTAPGTNGTTSVGRFRGVSIGASSKVTIALVPPPDAYPTFSGTVRDGDGVPLAGCSAHVGLWG